MAALEGPAAVFDHVADTYDTVGVPWFVPIAAALVEQLAVRPGERVLDVGCGRGAALRPLAEATGPRGYALGIDLAPRMVELTSADLAALPQVEVRVADARAPDVPARSFDVVAASLVLFFLPEPVAALTAWHALLVPGGRVGVTTFGAQDERWRAVDALFGPYLPAGMLDARASGRRGPYASDEGVERLLVDAGFEDVRTVTHTVEAVFRDPAQFLEFSWSHGQRAMWDAVPAGQIDELRAAMARAVGDAADASGRIAFAQEVRHTLGRRAP